MIRIPNFVSPRRPSVGSQRRSTSSRRGSSTQESSNENVLSEWERMTSPTATPPSSRTIIPPASLAARQGLLHFRMRAPSKEECVICAQCFDVNDVVTTLPCGHMHHSDCILGWLLRKCTCPTCRYVLPSEEEESPEQVQQGNSPAYHMQKQRKVSKITLFNPILGDSNGIPFDEDNCRSSGMPVYLADLSILAQE